MSDLSQSVPTAQKINKWPMGMSGCLGEGARNRELGWGAVNTQTGLDWFDPVMT